MSRDTGYLMYIQGMVDDDELKLLGKYAEEVDSGGVIVDIGTSDGKAALYLGSVSKPNTKVFTVDIEIEERFYKHVDYMELNHKVFYIRCTSSRLAGLWTTPIDMIFIDGSHNFEDVVKDIEKWVPHVKKGGIIAFHDYGNKAFGVTEAVDQFADKLYTKLDSCQLVYLAQKL